MLHVPGGGAAPRAAAGARTARSGVDVKYRLGVTPAMRLKWRVR